MSTRGKIHGEWDSVSTLYHTVVGQLTIPIAAGLVDWVHDNAPLNRPDVSVMDNGCGTGIVSSVLKRNYPTLPLLATDFSSGMIDEVLRNAEASGWTNFQARFLDSRNLTSVETESITHLFTTFMICLAPDPDQIASEMHRVLQHDGILGLAVWAEPNFGFFEAPWIEACQELDPTYEAPTIMDPAWTKPENIRRGLAKAGFERVEIKAEQQSWDWENVNAVSTYFFDGQNPGNTKWQDSWTGRGQSLDKVRPLFERKLEEAYGQSDGSLKGSMPFCLAIARK
ncbi:MAG: hypothetical protein Q9195_000300 [Heterodermia aff. obscurata]